MNVVRRTARPNRLWGMILLIILIGCRSSPYAQRTPSPAPSSPQAPLGTSLEDIDARNRADIAERLGRPVAPGPATPAEVVAMTRAGVEPRFIVCYINRSTDIAPVGAQDVIYMHEQGVDEQVIQAMLTPGSGNSRAEIARSMPPHVVILTGPWWPYYYPSYGFGCGYRFY